MNNTKYLKNGNKNGIFLLRFVTSYSILLIFVLIMGLLLCQYGIKDAKSNLEKQNKSILYKSVNTLDQSLNLINALVTQISNESSLRSLVKMTDTQSTDFQINAQIVKSLLSDFYPLQAILPLHDYYIYLPKPDYVLSSHTLSDVQLFYKHYKAFDEALYQDWLSIINKENFHEFIEMKPYYKGNFNSFLYKVPILTSFLTGNTDATICFEISETKLEDIFSTSDLFQTGFLLVTDHNNNEVFRITSTETKTNSLNLLLTAIKEQKLDFSRDSSRMKLGDESVIVTKAQSSIEQWNYYLVQPSELVFMDLNSYYNAYGIIIILTCIFCLILIYVLSKRNIKPILEFKTKLEDSLQEKDSLVLKLEEQRPIIYNSYMARIMKGLILDEQEAEEIKDFLCLNQPDKKYSVLYASVYENQIELYVEDSLNGSEKEDKQSDYREIIRSYFYDYFGDDILIYDVEINSFAILLTTDSHISLEEVNKVFEKKFIKLHNQLMSDHAIWIFGGLGNRNHQLSYLWKSYQQSIQAISYIHEGNVFQSFMDIKRDKTSYYYPVEMAQQLSNFISFGNTKQVNEIFRLLKKVNFEDISLPVTVVKWLFSDIRNTLLKVRFQMNVTEENQKILESVDSAFHETMTLELLEEISIKLCSLNEQKVEGNRLITNIQSYIRENYMDSSLSLKKISEVFNISESYFSYLFKAETKQNFSEYLELIRMDQAMILLKTTDINISNMYLELGYNNANSFRRAFKKVHGVSPKTIRESNIAYE